MKTEFEKLNSSLTKLEGAIAFMSGEQGYRMGKMMSSVNENFDALRAKAEATAAPATPSSPLRLHELGTELVLHDMGLFAVRPDGTLFDGTMNRTGASQSDTFPVSIEKIVITQKCNDLKEQLYKSGNRLINRSAVRGKLVDIWKRIIDTDSDKPNLEIYRTEFAPFFEDVVTVINEAKRRDIGGVEIFAQQ